MSVSVVIPVWNGASALPWSVPSVLALGNADEIIWVDDGSTDDTAGVLARLTASDARARVLRLSQNSGRAAARNAGAGATDGQMLVFLDADVRPASDLIARFTEALAFPDAVATVAHLTFDGLGDDPYHAYLAAYPRGAHRSTQGTSVPWKTFVTTACAVTRDAFDTAGGFDEQIGYGEDLALACVLATPFPRGLVSSHATAEMTDAGTLETALAKVAEFGRALPALSRRCPNLYRIAGLEGLANPPAWMRASASDPVARIVRRLVLHVPAGLQIRAVRYLLGQSLLHAHADAARSLARSGRR